MGGSAACAVLIALVRTKAMAVMLGPAGFGLIGALSSIAELARAVAGAGIGGSGVRQIAHAARDNDVVSVSRTARVLVLLTVLLGIMGAAAVLLGSRPIAWLTFGNAQHVAAVTLLSLVVLLGVIGEGRMALLQGMRRMGNLAMVGVLGPLTGTFAALLLVYWLGQDGVAPALVALAGASLAVAWWYSRKLKFAPTRLDAAAVRNEMAKLLRLGMSFMLSALIAMGALYLVRVIVLHRFGLEAAGLYQAAWTLGGLYIGFILQAMSADFLPRLTSACDNDSECNRLVNEQGTVGLLLAGPGVIGTLALAGWALPILFSDQFTDASRLVRWFCVGMALRVVAWPISFMLVARSEVGWAIATDVVWGVVFVALAWVLVTPFGVDGAGMAFVAAYVVNVLLVYPLVRHMTGFRWSASNLKTIACLFSTMAVVFIAFRVLPPGAALALGCGATVAWAWWSASSLIWLVPSERLPRWVHRALAWRRSSADEGRRRPR